MLAFVVNMIMADDRGDDSQGPIPCHSSINKQEAERICVGSDDQHPANTVAFSLPMYVMICFHLSSFISEILLLSVVLLRLYSFACIKV